jgi:formylmethanofuran dehydrogenase subunit E
MTVSFEETAAFHGHKCPGLAIGYRMSLAGLAALAATRAADEELVAIVENNACGVDAVQCLTGCTFGKGNLLFRDFGKQVYTFHARGSRRGVRVVFHGRGMPPEAAATREARTAWILAAPAEAMLTVAPVMEAAPQTARIRRSMPCSRCGETVMETRLRLLAGTPVCIPCFLAGGGETP